MRGFLVVVLVLPFVLSGCVMQYEVTLVNETSKTVLVRLVQYHSERFDGTPPTQFSESLAVKHQDVRLAPSERSKIVFNSGSGGFWLRWKVLDGSAVLARWATLDLIRDKPTIHIR
jgi:hypothetical protein